MPGNEEADRSLAMADEALARLDVPAAVAYLSAAVRRLTEDCDCRAAAIANEQVRESLRGLRDRATAAYRKARNVR